MYFKTLLSFAAVVATACGSTIPNEVIVPRATCPTVWKNIAVELSGSFASGLGCTQEARAAIRATFHDCFTSAGGCDGSLLLAGEINWSVNAGLVDTINYLNSLRTKYSVGAADLVQFAGGRFEYTYEYFSFFT
jgi:manganese peroxidase